MRRYRLAAILPILFLLGGCQFVVLHPSGDVALQQRDLVVISTVLMLLIIIPVMALTVLFAWRYRQSNKQANYDPDWDHSTQLELVIWAAPLLIIICLGALTWMGTHLLDPYRPIERIAADKPIPPDTTPLDVEVVALDWKWLFIYPQYGVASLNELAAPVDRPINFRITSATVMNSFYIPALAGQIYAMPGMETRLHAVINEAGTFKGFSANFSGSGFSGMHFAFHGQTAADFDAFVAAAKADGTTLGRTEYLELERPSENVPARRFASVDPELYGAILNMCVEPGKMCMSEMSAIDAKGGLGLAGVNNVLPLIYDKYARRGTALGPAPTYVASICTLDEALAAQKNASGPITLPNRLPVLGAGLGQPSFTPISLPALPPPPAVSRLSNS